MKTTFAAFSAVALLLALFTPSSAKADMIRGGSIFTETITINNGGNTSNVYLSPMQVTDITSGQSFLTFCGDAKTTTSPAFGSTTGQSYGYFNLYSPSLTIYSAAQRTYVGDLLSYTYGQAFNDNGSVKNKNIAQALQLAIWEVLSETSGTLNITSGTFFATGIPSAVSLIAQNLLEAAQGSISWESLGYVPRNNTYEITVFVAEGGVSASQTLISVVVPTGGVTPEPASMIFFGFGLAAIYPFMRRRKMD